MGLRYINYLALSWKFHQIVGPLKKTSLLDVTSMRRALNQTCELSLGYAINERGPWNKIMSSL
jgi:hypothetical protein